MRPCNPPLNVPATVLLLIVAACSGCARIHRTPDLCACALDRCELVRELDCIFDCNCQVACPGACGGGWSDEFEAGASVCDAGGCEPALCAPPLRECGPPPVRYRPPEPPTFMTVPTAPVFSDVPPDAPLPAAGSVEVGYRRELTFPGRD